SPARRARPARPRPSTSRPSTSRPSTSRIVSADGTTIAFEEKGEGPALILVDGALSTGTSGSKAGLVELLAPQLRVYSFDRRGRGDSGDTPPYALEREIEDIEALVEHAGGSAFLYGHSSGACLVLEAALRLGEKATKLALYEAPYEDDPADRPAWAEYLRQLADALASNRRGDAVALFMAYVGTPPDQVAAMRQAPSWAQLEAVAPTLAYDHAGILGESRAIPAARLAAVGVPTLAMYGGAGPPSMAGAARTLSRTLPLGELRVLEGQTHAVQPAALAPVLVEFFLG
ncbi:MAG: alpha/beta hydrolase, partial [Acidimicrobiales bacterium]|nr:alpha/beta hydrolase [Acidimicrobiales bacterium]